MSHRNNSPTPGGGGIPQRPTAKRSPSILVTDSRQHALRGARAPFAGHNFRKQQEQREQQQKQSRVSVEQRQGSPNPQPQSSSSGSNHHQPLFSQQEHDGALNKRFGPMKNRYTDISVDKLLSNSSDIPSGQSRLPSLLSSTKSLARGKFPTAPAKRNIRSIPKLSQSLPPRTSKTSQKLVLIPEDDEKGRKSPTEPSEVEEVEAQVSPNTQRSRAELMSKDERAHEFCRTTAYFMCEEFNLVAVSKFLRKHHGVKPRLYDEALYVPYTLPLLPGTDGFRVKSNNTAKFLPNSRYMEKLINKTEQTNHLYEYFSGVETPEDAGNYSMDPELVDQGAPFDPSEPQYFAPPNATTATTEFPSKTPSPITSSQSSPRETAPVPSEPPKPDEQVSTHTQAAQGPARHHGEMFVFAYGIVVFWNFSETHEKNILADLAFADDDDMLINPIDEQDIETEEFHFEYDPCIQRPRIYNDMITLRSQDHLIKLTMSHAIAQSTKLCLFESSVVNSLQSISKLPKKLALTGSLGLKRNQLLKKSGKIFKLKVDVNLSSSILDTPAFFWDLEPALHPLYAAVRDYLEIDQRVQVINDRCKVFLEFADIVADSINEKNTNRVAWMLIIIIFLSLAVSIFEFILEIL